MAWIADWRRGRALLACLALALLACPPAATAHDVPGQMRVHVFAKPEGERLHLLIRLPLALLLNLDLPKRGPGYLDLARIDEALARAVTALDADLDLLENGQRLPLAHAEARISMPSDRAFDSFDSARALLRGPRLPETAYVFWNQGYFDAHLEYPIASPRSSFALDFRVAPGLRERLKIDVRYHTAQGVVRAYEIATGSGPLALDPRWHQAARSFVRAGFAHILDGPDHLLFLVCLIIPYRRMDWSLVGVVTSFTVAHSITLLAAAYGGVPAGNWFAPLVETLIAASIVYLAVENLVRPNLARRWLVSGLFGLVHGFGFSFMLQEQLQFAGGHLVLSLLAFNAGIELGQLLVLAVTLPVVAIVCRSRRVGERALAVGVCVLAAHTAWHWMDERFEALRKADWPLPGATASDALVLLAAGGLLVGVACLARQRRRVAEKP